ncbi:methionyl-tRNA formyltransferase [Thalassospiraceae bacterium LMO-JJ14]|nr:methionyl-tRNA formyltransferase [Thalassospiraceae bacterium LMO-JJ14]
MGSPDFSLPSLHALIEAGHEVVCVYAQPPKPAGRGHRETPCPVHAEAIRLGLQVRTPGTLRDPGEQAVFRDLDLDCAVVVAYGLILPAEILEAPRLGCINVHASLLPRWRGAAPIQRALIAGDTETGVGIMKMDVGLDTGAVLAEARTPIAARETASSLHDRLADMGAELLVRTLDGYAAGDIQPVPQPENGITYAHKLERGEGRLDFSKPAAELERTIRALNPWPGTWFEYAGERIKVAAAETVPGASGDPGSVLDGELTIACGDGALRPLKVQRPGKSMTDVQAFLRGYPIGAGSRLD